MYYFTTFFPKDSLSGAVRLCLPSFHGVGLFVSVSAYCVVRCLSGSSMGFCSVFSEYRMHIAFPLCYFGAHTQYRCVCDPFCLSLSHAHTPHPRPCKCSTMVMTSVAVQSRNPTKASLNLGALAASNIIRLQSQSLLSFP